MLEAIGINLPLLIAFVVNFLILFGLLGVILYKPVLKMLDERTSKIKDSMDQAEKIKVQLEKTEAEIKQQLEIARKEGQKIIAQAEQIGERLKTEAKDEARREAESFITKAHAEIRSQRDKDIEELRSQFATIAISAAEKVINQSLDKEKHRKLLGEVLEEAKFK
jgi:F-type H+-transporting ATPase subunit b